MRVKPLLVAMFLVVGCGDCDDETSNNANNGNNGNNANNVSDMAGDAANNVNNTNNANNSNNANNANNTNNMTDMGMTDMGYPTQQEFCDGQGPPVIQDAMNVSTCTGDLAAVTFRYALCSCGEIDLSNEVFTDSFDSRQGPYMAPGQSGGSIGTNANYSHTNKATIGGSLITGGAGLSDLTNDYSIAADMRVAGSFESTGVMTIGNDSYIGGDASLNSYNVAGTHYQPAGATYSVNNENVGAISRVPVNILPPCDCAQDQLLDIAGFVSAYATRNDNASINLDPAALTDAPATQLDLTCGRFYLDEISSNAEIVITAKDRTALFIGGDVDLAGKFTVRLDPGAELDIFVAGSFLASNEVDLGSIENPANVRLYIGGTEPSRWNNKFTIGGNVYAPFSDITITNATEIYGSLFVKSLRATNKLTIHYDTAVLQAGELCPDPQIPNGNLDMGMPDMPTDDMGTPPQTCQDCRDCNNQACNDGVCGSCQTSADCCSPLFCVQGQCVPVIN